MSKSGVNINQIRRLSGAYEAGELESCLQDAVQKGTNECLAIQGQTASVAVLSMACFVRSQMEETDVSVHQALRILGQRMRRFG